MTKKSSAKVTSNPFFVAPCVSVFVILTCGFCIFIWYISFNVRRNFEMCRTPKLRKHVDESEEKFARNDEELNVSEKIISAKEMAE